MACRWRARATSVGAPRKQQAGARAPSSELGNDEAVEVQVCVQHGYGLDKLLLQPDNCGHGEQGQLSLDHSAASDVAHNDFATMAIDAPAADDNWWKAVLRNNLVA